MEKITFVNNSEPYLSAENLNQIQDNTETAINEIKGTELYNSTGNNNTNIPLNDDISNYKYYEVFYIIKNTANGEIIGSSSIKGIVGVGSAVISENVFGNFTNVSSYGTRIYSSKVSISGTTLTKVVGYNFTLKTDNTMVFNDILNEIFITKVVGYK